MVSVPSELIVRLRRWTKNVIQKHKQRTEIQMTMLGSAFVECGMGNKDLRKSIQVWGDWATLASCWKKPRQ